MPAVSQFLHSAVLLLLPNISPEWHRRFEFQKRSQLFIRARNETLSVAAMCVRNEMSRMAPGVRVRA